MSVPRVARIHLVYQFIILIFLLLLVFAISYNEVLPDKRILFLVLIPIFCYQLVIVFCCTELLPLPTWFSLADESQNEVNINQEHKSDNEVSGSPETSLSEVSKSPAESKIISPTIPRARLVSKNKKTPDAVSSSDANTQTSASDTFKKAPYFTKASARRSESTRSYGFNHRENKFEDRLDSNENVRSYRSRNWRSLQEQKGAKSHSNLKSPNHPVEEIKEVTSPLKLETLEESIETDSSDLSRSYSFPFRHRKHSRGIELGDNLNDLNIPVMPAWNAIDYFSPSSNTKRRKSISTEAIDRELRLINSHFDQNAKNDFTQSMEVAREPIVEPVITKRGLKSSASFNKWKQGVANYFVKTKLESIKSDDDKNRDSKKPFFKELFSSKEVLFQGPEKKAVLNKRSDSSYPKLDNRMKISNRSPSYISYETDYFLD